MNRLLLAADRRTVAGTGARQDFAARRQKIAQAATLRDHVNEASPTSPHPHPHTTISRIMEAVAEFYGLATIDLLSVRKTRDVTEPRGIAMFLCFCETDRSANNIAGRFGRDRTSVEDAAGRVALLLTQGNERLAKDVAAIRLKLGLIRNE